jgi:hypothetical protein
LLCGEQEVVFGGNIRKEPLITPSQLGAMQVGQALVMINGKTKFIMWLPDFTEIFKEAQVVRTRPTIGWARRKKTSVFDIQKFVEEKRQEKLRKILDMNKEDPFDEDEIIRRINAKIASLEKNEA